MHVCGCEHTCGLLSVCFEKACMCWLPWVLCGHVCVHCAHTCGAPVIRPCMPSCVWAGLGLHAPSLSGTRAGHRKTEAEGQARPCSCGPRDTLLPSAYLSSPTLTSGFLFLGFYHIWCSIND